MASPRFWHRLIRFRHVIDGLLALASPNRACRDQVPVFPQRSPPSLLTTAACGGLRSVPDHRPRRALLLHLSYSCAPTTHPALVTHRHTQTLACSGPANGCCGGLLLLNNRGCGMPRMVIKMAIIC